MAIEIGKRRYIVNMETKDDHSDNEVKRVRVNPEPTKIIHLNDDCLEEICLYLKLKDLGNLAVSNTQFLSPANYVFKRNYADTLIKFHPFATNINMYKKFLSFLDAFGGTITKLNITFYQERRYRARNQKFVQIINEKCSKSVVELTLVNVPSDIIMTKPFLRLRKLMITDSFLNNSMVTLIRNSPNISSLEFDTVENVFDSALVEYHIPLLEHFANYNQVIKDCQIENLRKFRQFANANQQITSLGIGSSELEMMFQYEDVQRQFFKTIHRKLSQSDEHNHIEYLLPFEPIYFGNVKCLSLGLGYSIDFLDCIREQRLRIANLPFEELKLYVGDFSIHTVDFMVQCRRLRKLHVYVTECLDTVSTAAIALNSPELHELELFLLYKHDLETTIMPSSMGIIIKHCNPVKRVVVHFEIRQPLRNTDENYKKNTAKHFQPILAESFAKHLSNDWQVHCETQNMQIDRHNSRNAFILSVILLKQAK